MSGEAVVVRLLEDFVDMLVLSDDRVVEKITATNAGSFGLDQYEISECESDGDGIHFRVELTIAGHHDARKDWAGDRVKLTLSGVVKDEVGDWDIGDYEIEEISVNT